jgi:hypothetical protein
MPTQISTMDALPGLIIAYNGKCQYCGETKIPGEFHVDHILPKSKGGKDELENYILACKSCNVRKNNLLMSPGGLILLTAFATRKAPIILRELEKLRLPKIKKSQKELAPETNRKIKTVAIDDCAIKIPLPLNYQALVFLSEVKSQFKMIGTNGSRHFKFSLNPLQLINLLKQKQINHEQLHDWLSWLHSIHVEDNNVFYSLISDSSMSYCHNCVITKSCEPLRKKINCGLTISLCRFDFKVYDELASLLN